MKEQLFLEIKGVDSLTTKFGITNYFSELTDNSKYIRSMPTGNFLKRADNNLLASNDFRVIVKDHKGNIPEGVMYNIASVAYLMIGGLIDYEVAYAYITERMRIYGVPFLEFKSQGYLSIDLYRNKEDIKYKSRLSMPNSTPKV